MKLECKIRVFFLIGKTRELAGGKDCLEELEVPEDVWGIEECCVYYADRREISSQLMQRLIFGTRLLTRDELAGTERAKYPEVRVTVTIKGIMSLMEKDVLLSVLGEGLIEDCFK